MSCKFTVFDYADQLTMPFKRTFIDKRIGIDRIGERKRTMRILDTIDLGDLKKQCRNHNKKKYIIFYKP